MTLISNYFFCWIRRSESEWRAEQREYTSKHADLKLTTSM